MLSNKNKPSFHSEIKQILDLYRINYTGNLQTMTTNNACKYYRKMTETYIQFWKDNLTKSRKLDLYKSFKMDYHEELYLKAIKNNERRITFTKFRISNHNLAIEAGRYGNVKAPAENRICVYCEKRDIETEKHMIFKCTKCKDLRSVFLTKIKLK